ncbi:putative addiction module antidote protein [Candidatus Dependentiae bacterium]|nr:putative addiction module antidote protein [Candidatus Dependentiae bacterium]
MTRKKRAYRNLQELIADNVQDPQEAAAYLKAALEDEDERVFLLALRDVLEARGGGISDLAQSTGLNKQNLYRMLSKKGNPRLTSLKMVLHSIGFEMDIKPLKK